MPKHGAPKVKTKAEMERERWEALEPPELRIIKSIHRMIMRDITKGGSVPPLMPF